MNGTRLDDAHRQWANRPDDERFASLDELRAACKADAEESKTLRPVDRKTLSASATGDDLALSMGGAAVAFTNWSFSQACSLGKAPGGFLGELPPAMAADVLNFRFKDKAEGTALPLVRVPPRGPSTLRALTSERYGRFWSLYLVESCLAAQERGWIVPPAYGNKPAGIYHSDRDTFVFMIDGPEGSIMLRDSRSDRTEKLRRGFFWQNSEVGARRYEITTFLFNEVCGNHYVWGATDVQRVCIRHVGEAVRRIPETFRIALEGARRSMDDDIAGIRLAMEDVLGADRKAVVKAVTDRLDIPARTADLAYTMGAGEGSNPTTAWGMVQGLTAVARLNPHADERVDLERVAVRLLPKPRTAPRVLEV